MALNKREQNLLIATITLVVLGLNYVLFAPLLGSWRKLESDLHRQGEQLTVVKTTIAHVPEWRTGYENLRRNLKQSESFETISDVLKKVDEIGSQAGILMQSKRSMKEEAHDVYREWPVACTCEANVETLVKFLHGLQTGSGFLTVEQLSVTAKPDNASILRCEIQLRALAAKTERPAS